MKRLAKVSVSDLKIGDRFYEATDIKKNVLQIIAPKDGKLMCCPVEFANSSVENKKSFPIKENTQAIFLRNANN